MGKKKQYEREPTQVEWAKLAAYIDGEGCLCIDHARRKWRDGTPCRVFILRVSVHNVDPRLAYWCKAVAESGYVHADPRPYDKGDNYKRRPMFSWIVNGAAAARVLEGCLPHFTIKREQAEVAILMRQTYGGHNYQRRHALKPGVIDYRLSLQKELKRLKKELPPSAIEAVVTTQVQ